MMFFLEPGGETGQDILRRCCNERHGSVLGAIYHMSSQSILDTYGRRDVCDVTTPTTASTSTGNQRSNDDTIIPK
jgi:hypothetical protein